MKTYTFHINLCDLAFLGAIFLGAGLAALLWFSKKTNQAANRFFALALVIVVLYVARLLAIDIGLTTYIPHWSRLPLQFSTGFGALIFFYVLQLTRPQFKFRFKDLRHFIPLLLELSVHLLEVKESIRTGAATYDTMTFHQLNPVLQWTAFISVVAYLYASHQLIENFYRRLQFNRGDRYRDEMSWLHRVLTGFGLLWLCWVFFTAAHYLYYHDQLGIQAYDSFYLLLAILSIWTAAIAFLRPEASLRSVTPSFFKPAPPAELKQKSVWLKKVLKTKLYYQDPELNLRSLA